MMVTRPLAGRGSELTQVTEQTPDSVPVVAVRHWPSMRPPSVVKVTAVPSGTGLLKRSARRTVTGTTTPSIAQASTLNFSTASDRLSESGMPVVIVSWFDWVEIWVERTRAVTRTVVATVPACTTACTRPLASLRALCGEKVMPPTDVLREKSTSLSATEPPVESTTRNTTVDVSLRFTPPVPCSEMLVGVADTN